MFIPSSEIGPRETPKESVWGHPSDLGKASIIASSVVLFVITLFLALRLWLQYQRKRLFTTENGLLIVALLIEYAAHSTNIATNFISQSWTRPAEAENMAVWFWGTWVFLIPVARALIKTSICLFLKNIFNNRRFTMAAWSIIAFCYLTVGMNLVYLFVPCPVPEDYIVAQKKCNMPLRTNLFYTAAAMGLASEIAIFILPFPMLSTLLVHKKQRYSLIAIFSLGFLSIFTDINLIAANMLPFKPVPAREKYFTITYSLNECLPFMVACAMVFRPIYDSVFRFCYRKLSFASSSAGDSSGRKGSMAPEMDQQVPTIGGGGMRRKPSDDVKLEHVTDWTMLSVGVNEEAHLASWHSFR